MFFSKFSLRHVGFFRRVDGSALFELLRSCRCPMAFPRFAAARSANANCRCAPQPAKVEPRSVLRSRKWKKVTPIAKASPPKPTTGPENPRSWMRPPRPPVTAQPRTQTTRRSNDGIRP
ncbi:MAG: hypothetical protein DCC68_16015 [Planctomycetota bacterium]|nr:MAG: hypothetical protein DCC68_16015 [Planctomycetota bacterium]